MSQKDNILEELKELNSSLANRNPENIYQVPTGYFEGLVDQVLSRIKALEANNPVEELNHLSPFLSKLSKKMPYAIPHNYFESLDPLPVVNEDINEELSSLSPLLSKMNKQMPYSVPQGYFEQLAKVPVETKPAKLVSMGARKWFKYAAAAVITGIIVMAGYFYMNGRTESGKKVMAKVTKDVKKMNEIEKDKLMDFIDAGLSGHETAQVSPDNKSTIKELLEDVPVEEMKDLEEQTEDIEDLLMTN